MWVGRSRRVIGVEPNVEYLAFARQRDPDASIEYRSAYSHATGIPGGAADVVTCVQSLHWMEPESTFREVDRILRSGGVLGVIHSDLFPVIAPEVDQGVEACLREAGRLARERRLFGDQRKWGEAEINAQIQRTGRFRYVRKFALHRLEKVTVDTLIGRVKTSGPVAALLDAGADEDELGIADLQATAARRFGGGHVERPLSFHVTACVKQ